MIKLSIIIPIYNAENYIEDCMKSILDEIDNQTEIEVIMINDGSTDNSDKICNELNKNNKVVRYIKQSNKGVAQTRNRGIKEANGNYIMFVDADDKMTKNWYKNIMSNINDEADIYYFQSSIFPKNYDKPDIIFEIVDIKHNLQYMAAPWSKIYKREFLIKNKILFPANIINGEDMLFNIQCIQNCNTFKEISHGIYAYRISPFSATHRFDDKIFDSDLKFHKILNKILNLKNTPSKEMITNYLLYNAIYTLAERISYSTKYNITIKKYLKKLLQFPYKDANTPKNIPIKKKIIVCLIRAHCFLLVYNIFNLKRYLKSKTNYNEEYFINL